MTIDTLMAFAGIVFLLAIVPGPNALLILYTSVSFGRRFALTNILGFAVAFLIHAYVSAKGLSLLLSQSAMAFSIFKWVGVIYLIWLGISNIRNGIRMAKINVNTAEVHQKTTIGGSFVRGFLTNMLNPKIVMFYLSIFPQFVDPQHLMQQSLLLGMVQALVVGSWFVLVIFFATRLKSWLSAPTTSRWLNYVSGSLFIGFGASLTNARM
ncbi:Putative threonine/Lysine efflux family protein [Vibrio nigripulchritudo SFn27]|uniref:Putative threonine/Lysine efflux family protein n=1 Tax=Vibrio nigripulchritudo TaxID=28173 RepID=U4KHX9_9VIBR|nr:MULTISPECIES: LysE family translocator [Vibrio]UAB73373.1 LysE family translocator [Vibrio sp. SCSIO 43132]CCN84602.1 Putative threonine/Lysine efflux family protein [Vibrio nigripulchritudo BLFn1]CCN90885.1 Putative threonine/Lysine efflux family protein [Vibrio nigripulchritudo SFn27]CCO41226.1 Putative threonine/Lysine efflux family protein [Vibrio nigripulchritudo SFn135]CCO54563.1 Putative threonine/Lysine efflux family protein [Vibrio nigripulchritudo Wn13]